MAIKFYLHQNPLASNPAVLSARVISNRILDLNAVIQEILQRRTRFTEADIRSFLHLMFEVITDELAEGNTVNLPLLRIRPGITGTFNREMDRFDKARHQKHATLSAGLLLRKKMAGAKTEKVSRDFTAPKLDEFTDINTNLRNSTLSAGGIGMIVGKQLKFAADNPEEGLFFIDAFGNTTKAASFAQRTESRLLFQIPDFPLPGTYSLEVRKGYGVKKGEIRTGILNAELFIK